MHSQPVKNMSIICFGDPIPGVCDDDYFVSYTLEDFPGGLLSGPFQNIELARSELRDIVTFDNIDVRNAKIVTRKELLRKNENEPK